MGQNEDWNAPWLNRTNWILAHLENFHLEAAEALVVLLINYFNETAPTTTISANDISNKSGLDLEKVEQIIDSLSEKGYLNVRIQRSGMQFLLDGLYHANRESLGGPIQQGLIREIGNEFGRPLSGSEMERILRWQQEFEESTILRALDEASAYDRRTLSYIESLLQSWKQRGLSAEDIESGKR